MSSSIADAIDGVVTTAPTPPVSYGWVACDSCQTAQAIWRVIGNSGDLFFCGHHKNKMEAKLTAWATDFEELITVG
jgi:hypothetical protein